MSEAHKTPCDDIYCEQFLCVQKRDNEGHTELRDWDKRMAEKDAALAKRNARIAALESSLRESKADAKALGEVIGQISDAFYRRKGLTTAQWRARLVRLIPLRSPAPAAKEDAHG